MKKGIHIFLLIFYSFGTFCLPLGDFDALKEVPEMYRHCKATEDKDMTFLDFLSDHFINIDSLFDKHGHGDEQKPHAPQSTKHHEQAPTYFFNYFSIPLLSDLSIEPKPSFSSEHFYTSEYFSNFLRPPIGA